jgi:glucose/arabinose dehydrogenase
MRKIIWTALSAAVALMAIGPSTSAALDCSAQPLGDCSQILIGLPYLLQFDDGSAGQILDSVGQGTGFTFLDPRGDGGGYLPANLLIHGGRLEVTTTDGTAEGASNTQDNELGVGIDAPSQVTRIQVTIENPDIGTGASEQAGLWFGNDQDNQVALTLESTADGPRVGFSLQDSGATAPGLEQSPVLSFDPGQTLTLILIIDPETRRIEARYRIGDQGAESSLGTGLTAPGEFFSFDAAGIDPLIGTNSFGGIFATQGSTAPPLTYYFDDFQVSKERDVGVPPTDLTSQGIAFKRASFPVPNPTSMVFGPDGRLYVSELLGPIHALTLNADHQPIADQVINTLGTRLTLGLAIDPHSTPGNVILWASHSSPDLNAGEENSSTVSRLSGPGFANREDVITGLPRAVANHSVNSIHFGPDGRLYIAVGGNTGAGAPNDDPDSMAEFGQRPEQPLSAALLVADVGAPGFQGDCATPAGQFGPPPSSCDVHTYATGFRNMYDFVFHSNGAIYGPDNGLGITGTFPPSPAPDCTGLADPAPWNGDPPGDNPGIQPDELNRIVQGGYYGHPDPYRNECVFGDGSWQGVTPPPNYQPPILDLGDHRSADGTIEYTSSAGCGSLKGNLVLSNFSVGDNLTRIELSSDGRSVVRSQT